LSGRPYSICPSKAAVGLPGSPDGRGRLHSRRRRGTDARFSMAGGAPTPIVAARRAIVNNTALDWTQLSLNPPSESLQEFKAESNNYSASSATRVAVDRHDHALGTNKLHGRPTSSCATTSWIRGHSSPPRSPIALQHLWCLSWGPIWKDRTFFFVNYEGARRRSPQCSPARLCAPTGS